MASLSFIYTSNTLFNHQTPQKACTFSLQNQTNFPSFQKPIVLAEFRSLSRNRTQNPAVGGEILAMAERQRNLSSKTPVKPGIVPEGLGLVATRDIPRNDVVLEVPRKLWINPEAAATSEIGSACSALKPRMSVALFLLRERFKGEESKWKYCLDVLPQGTDSTIYW